MAIQNNGHYSFVGYCLVAMTHYDLPRLPDPVPSLRSRQILVTKKSEAFRNVAHAFAGLAQHRQVLGRPLILVFNDDFPCQFGMRIVDIDELQESGRNGTSVIVQPAPQLRAGPEE